MYTFTGWGAQMNTCTNHTEPEIRVHTWSPKVQRIRNAWASSLWPAPQFFLHILVIFLSVSHSSIYSMLPWLIVPAGCLSYVILSPESCSLNLEHTCSSLLLHNLICPNSSHAFKSLIKHCSVCKDSLNYPKCTLSSLPSFLCTFFLCTDVQY